MIGGTRAEQSSRTRLIMIGSPLVILAVLVYIEIIAIRRNGFEPSDLGLWAMYLACLAFCCLPLLTVPRSVVVNAQGIHLSLFVGAPRLIRWPDVKSVEIRGRAGHKGVYVKPAKGRAVTIPSIMANYEEVAAAITALAPGERLAVEVKKGLWS